MKRSVSIALAACMLFILVGCSNQEPATSGDIGDAAITVRASEYEPDPGLVIINDDETPLANPDENVSESRKLAAQIFNIVNEERKKEGLHEFKWNEELYGAALIRAQEIITLFDHTRPDNRSCFSVFDDCGISAGEAGENIAMGQKTASETMKDWMDSPMHRENILGNYTYMAVGVVENPENSKYGGFAFVQLFYNSK